MGEADSESELHSDDTTPFGSSAWTRLIQIWHASWPWPLLLVTAALLAAVCAWVALPKASISAAAAAAAAAALSPAPVGTNFGGWLVLEDWFFSGETGLNVMTLQKDNRGQGVCLPPLLQGTAQTWPSEGILVQRLNDSIGWHKTAEVFSAHRHSFIGNSDFEKIETVGLRIVRIPITWAVFADALTPIAPDVYGMHNPETDEVVVPDPYYVGTAAFVTVPRKWLAALLLKATKHNFKLLLDIHVMPGGSSQGTYNGVWPFDPKFWTEKSMIGRVGDEDLATLGLWVAQALIRWVESLDPALRRGIEGLTLMNEPAHMSAEMKGKGQPFVRDEQQILDWLAKSSQMFRESSLPSQGIKLYVNIIESAFANFWELVGPWWSSTFSISERRSWAVLDIHWYAAWFNGLCDGRVVKGGAFFCDEDLDKVRERTRLCIGLYAEDFRRHADGLRACTELSAGTYQDALLGCNDEATLRAFLEAQVSTLNENGIDAFFWTWRMPFGSTFQRQWSLKAILGLEDMPVVSPCRLGLGVVDHSLDA